MVTSAWQMVTFAPALQLYSGGGGGFSSWALAGWTATKENTTRDNSRTTSEQMTRNSFIIKLLFLKLTERKGQWTREGCQESSCSSFQRTSWRCSVLLSSKREPLVTVCQHVKPTMLLVKSLHVSRRARQPRPCLPTTRPPAALVPCASCRTSISSTGR